MVGLEIQFSFTTKRVGRLYTALPQDEQGSKGLPAQAKGQARIYDAFAIDRGQDSGTDRGYATWDNAVQRHRFVEDLYQKLRGVN